MKYAPLAPRAKPNNELPDAAEIRAAAKKFILERLECGDVDEIDAQEMLAELGLRHA